MGTRRSSSDAEALRRAWRGRSALLGLVILGALAAAAYSWFRPQGSGAPEVPNRVLVVAGNSGVDHEAVLTEAGFEATEFTLAEWERRANGAGLEGSGPELVIELADQLGYGYVAFETPARFDLSGLDFAPDAPTIGEDTRYAVVSVGDLAFPHQLTVDGKPSEVVRMPSLGLLQALYAQPRLDPERETLSERPTVDELNLQDRITPGLKTVERVARLERTAEQIEEGIGEQLVEPGTEMLAGPLESGGVVPLPDGGVLGVVQRVRLESRDGALLDYVLEDSLDLGWTPVARGRTVGAPQVCDGLLGGRLPVSAYPELRASTRGGALLLRTTDGGSQVFLSVGDAEAPCRFDPLGMVAEPGTGDAGIGVPSEQGVVARAAPVMGGSRARVELHVPGDTAGEPELLGSLGGIALGAPVWLDEDLVAVAGHGWDGEGRVPDDGVYVFSRKHPGWALHLDGDALFGGGRIHDLAVVPGARPTLIVTVGRVPTRVLEVQLPADMEALFVALEEPAEGEGIGEGEAEGVGEAPDEGEAPPEAPGEGVAELPAVDEVALPDVDEAEDDRPAQVMFVAAELVYVRLVMAEGDVFDPTVSPDGRWLAFGWDPPHPTVHSLGAPRVNDRIGVVDLRTPGARPRELTEGKLEDKKPRWTRDGSALVFQSRVRVSVSDSEISAPRLVAFVAPEDPVSSWP